MDYPIKSIEDLMVEGATAKVAGGEEEACPYEEGSQHRHIWQLGWLAPLAVLKNCSRGAA